MEKLESFDVSVIWQILYDPYMIGCWIAISFIISWRTWSNSFSAIAETRSSSSSSSSEVNGFKSISLRQDNGGCYHSAATILGLHQLAIKHNVSMRMDFCDPQGGKGPVGDGKEVQHSNFALKENIELPSPVKITDVPEII